MHKTIQKGESLIICNKSKKIYQKSKTITFNNGTKRQNPIPTTHRLHKLPKILRQTKRDKNSQAFSL
jgi:hypothetical protein